MKLADHPRAAAFNQAKKGICLLRFLFLAVISLVLTAGSSAIDEVICFKEPFVLRILAGSINSEVGPWPEDFADTQINFELIGPNESQQVWKIKLDKQGRFNKKLPPGSYEFSIQIEGWDDAEGTIIIDKKADRKKTLSITLGLS